MSELVYVQGTFKEEIKNRFLCLVTVDSDDVLCYIPSSCRLGNFLDMPGRKVLLRPVATPGARTKYMLFAVRVGRRYIPVNLSSINSIFYAELHRRNFSFLGKRNVVLREAQVEGYKCDLYIPSSKTIIEIKSILAFEETAVFPSVISDRANRQLVQLGELLDKGYRVCYLFASLNSAVKSVKINSSMQEYYEQFSVCVNRGMMVRGFDVRFHKGEVCIGSPISVIP